MRFALASWHAACYLLQLRFSLKWGCPKIIDSFSIYNSLRAIICYLLVCHLLFEKNFKKIVDGFRVRFYCVPVLRGMT